MSRILSKLKGRLPALALTALLGVTCFVAAQQLSFANIPMCNGLKCNKGSDCGTLCTCQSTICVPNP